MLIPNYYFHLNGTEMLVFKTNKEGFELFSKHEASQETKIAEMKMGRWVFEDFYQRNLFFNLFENHKWMFGKAIKCYNKKIQIKSSKSIFNCFKRKTKIKFNKIKKYFL
jgi:hypothetical protein